MYFIRQRALLRILLASVTGTIMVGRFKYAWHGSGGRWDQPWVQAIGCAIVGLPLWGAGLSVPNSIADNPLLSALFTMAVAGFGGAILLFCLRLLWWPVHQRLEPYSGVIGFFRRKLGSRMWPLLLMGLAPVAFIIIFSAGAIWWVAVQPGIGAAHPTKPLQGNAQLNPADKEAIDAISSFDLAHLYNTAGRLVGVFNALNNLSKDKDENYFIMEAMRNSLISNLGPFEGRIKHSLQRDDLPGIQQDTLALLRAYKQTQDYLRRFVTMTRIYPTENMSVWLDADQDSLDRIKLLLAKFPEQTSMLSDAFFAKANGFDDKELRKLANTP